MSSKRPQLDALKDYIARQPGYAETRIDIVTVERGDSVPPSLFHSTTLFLCATSSANVIDVDQLEPGTLIVDDSFPLGFDASKAAKRIDTRGDILITVAGGFQGPTTFDLSDEADSAGHPGLDEVLHGFKRVANAWPDCMTGCIYSALVTRQLGLPETVGTVQLDAARRCLEILSREGFSGTPPYFITYGFDRPEPIYVIDRAALAPEASIGATPDRD